MLKTILRAVVLVALVSTVFTLGAAAQKAPQCAPGCYVNYGKCVCLKHLTPATPLDNLQAASLAIHPKVLVADGGPLPMCPPCRPGGTTRCGPNCSVNLTDVKGWIR